MKPLLQSKLNLVLREGDGNKPRTVEYLSQISKISSPAQPCLPPVAPLYTLWITHTYICIQNKVDKSYKAQSSDLFSACCQQNEKYYFYSRVPCLLVDYCIIRGPVT